MIQEAELRERPLSPILGLRDTCASLHNGILIYVLSRVRMHTIARYKKTGTKPVFLYLAEREGFEPSIRYKRIHTFQACAFNHSATSPKSQLFKSYMNRATASTTDSPLPETRCFAPLSLRSSAQNRSRRFCQPPLRNLNCLSLI